MARQTMTEFRSRLLRSFGATAPIAEELLGYTQSIRDRGPGAKLPPLPLVDELHVEAWRVYREEARKVGAFLALQTRLVQLRFPVREGISETTEYRNATRRGILPKAGEDGGGLRLEEPDRLRLELYPTSAGTIPILVAGTRADFVALVRAFRSRNEPDAVTPSMGACIVMGLNNWDRVHAYRRAWEASRGDDGGDWAKEFGAFAERKELYQDRFIILSRGPYSGIAAHDIGLDEAEWLERSFVIRRDHECTHYFTLRVYGTMKNRFPDEIIADFAGLVGAFGRYRGELALRFLGLESFPAYRDGGRLEHYRGEPPLSDQAFEVLKKLIHAAVKNLARFDSTHREILGRGAASTEALLALSSMSLEEMASDEMAERLERRLEEVGRGAPGSAATHAGPADSE